MNNISENIKLEASYNESLKSIFSQTFQSLNKISTKNIEVFISSPVDLHITSIIMKFNYNNKIYSPTLLGYFENIDDNSNGYIGCFSGNIEENSQMVSVIADITYINEKDFLVILTIGDATETSIPIIEFYGGLSKDISDISNKYSEKRMRFYEENKKGISDDISEHNFNNSQSFLNSVDAETRLKGSSTVSAGNYIVGRIDFYCANELRNQSTMSTYARGASYSSNFRNYLINNHGFTQGSIAVYPDTFVMEIAGLNKQLHSTRSVNPNNGSTSVNLTFPAYLPHIGYFTFSIPMTMSSTSVDFAAIPDSYYNDNLVRWNMYRRYGFSNSVEYKTNTENYGMAVHTRLTYEGNVTSSFNTLAGANCRIRYEYIHTVAGNSFTFHMWTGYASKDVSIKIIP